MRPSGIVLALVAFASLGAAQSGSLVGRVRAPGGVPLKGAQVILDDSVTRVVDDSGNFSIAVVAKGAHTMRVRSIGFGPVQHSFHVDPSERIDREFTLQPNADTLAAVTIVGARGQRIPAYLRGYEERKLFGVGHFVGADVLEKRGVINMSAALRFMPGITIKYGPGNSAIAVSTRERCNANVYLDGNLVSQGIPFDVNLLSPSSLHGVEYYAGAATIPVQYQRPGFEKCGVMLIWSK